MGGGVGINLGEKTMTGPWRFDIAMMMMWLLGVDNVYQPYGTVDENVRIYLPTDTSFATVKEAVDYATNGDAHE